MANSPAHDLVQKDWADLVCLDKARRVTHGAEESCARAEAALTEADEARELALHAMAEADGLRRAMQSRGYIDMAKGVIIARHGVDPERAFQLLRAESQRSHRKLIDVARAIVLEASRRPAGPGHHS